MKYQRKLVSVVLEMLRNRPPLIHVLIGARQVGKTTAAVQVVEQMALPYLMVAADAHLPPGPEWIESHWKRARDLSSTLHGDVLLVLDEVQKVRGWNEEVKRLWDEDRRLGIPVRVLLLGSSSLLLQKGLGDSLAGRYFLHRCPHWSLAECRDAFGWGLDQWIFFGGYPGADLLVEHPLEWKQYVSDSLIETVLSRDILQLQTVTKPALLRQLFALAASYPAQVLSYNKMLGQLLDAGNTTTLAHYLKLLETAFLVTGLELYSAGHQRKRGSSPKFVLWNQALINALSTRSFEEAKADSGWWGRLVENAVGAHLLNHLQGLEWSVTYWQRANEEIDYIVAAGTQVWALEVKSGRGGKNAETKMFNARYPRAKRVLLGGNGIPLEEFFVNHPKDVLG
jgi:uncharacterized protein